MREYIPAKNLARIDTENLKIILLNHQNNYVGCPS